MNFTYEGDVYRLIVRSKLPAAEKFESWVFDEVLPSIRKTGSYGQIDIGEIIERTAVAVAGEMTKQLIPLFQQMQQPCTCQSATAPFMKTPDKEKYSIPVSRCKLETFPLELRTAVNELMEEMHENFKINFSEISRFCTLHSFPISSPAVKRYYDYRF